MTAQAHRLPDRAAQPLADGPAHRLARGGGWWTLVLALAMLLAVTESLNAAAWTESLEVVRLAVLGGALLAFALSLTRWQGVFPVLYAATAGLVWISTLFNRLLFAGLSSADSFRELISRNADWIVALLGGTASADNLVFVTQLAILGWWIGYLALWSLMRHQTVLYAVLPAGVALFVNAFFASTGMTPFLIAYLAAVLLLALRIELARNEARWQVTRVRYAPDITLDFLKAGLAFTALVILLAWALPDAAEHVTAERLLRPLQGTWQRLEDTWNRLYGSLHSGRTSATAPSFGKSKALGGSVSLTDRPIFEAETPLQTYWRAAIYDAYTGSGWLNTDSDSAVIEEGQLLGEPRYAATADMTVTVRPLEAGQRTIFAPPRPLWVSVPVDVDLTRLPVERGGALISLISSRVSLDRAGSYQVGSAITGADPDRLRADGAGHPSWIDGRYLQLPDSLPERVRDLAIRATTGRSNPYDKAEALETLLRTYRYDLDIEAPPAGSDAVDHFLFNSREGYCDYYASAMVVMLRSVGVPARYVMGYTPGTDASAPDRDPGATPVYRIEERDAHAWPEVYFPSYGWIQFEPTASEPLLTRPLPETGQMEPGAVAERGPGGGNGDSLPPGQTDQQETGAEPRGGLWARLARNGKWLVATAATVIAGAIAWITLRRRAGLRFPSRMTLPGLFALLGRWAARLRVPWRASETPLERAALFGEAVPEAASSAAETAALFVAQRYGHQEPSPDAVASLSSSWRQLLPLLWRRWLVRRLTGLSAAPARPWHSPSPHDPGPDRPR